MMDRTITLYKWILSEFMVPQRAESVKRLEEHLSPLVRQGDEVLDLCCGAGPASFWFEEKGARVTGVDFAPYMIALAREEASRRSSTIEFIEADVHVLDFGQERYDIVACLGNSLTDFPLSAFASLGKRVARALKPNGRFVVQFQDGSYSFMQGMATSDGVYQENPERITYHYNGYLPELGACERIWRNETLKEEYHRIAYIYTAPVVRLILANLLEIERHNILREDHFLDVYKKRGRDQHLEA
jgi:ubiquinone/menaquinone biosynthesis C-methylase UbiE